MCDMSFFRRSVTILVPVFLVALGLIALGLSGWPPGLAAAQGAVYNAAPLAPDVSPTVPVRPTPVTSDSDGVPAEHGVLYFWSDSGTLYRVDAHTGLASPIVTIGGTDSVTGLAVGPNAQELFGCSAGTLYTLMRDGTGLGPVDTVVCQGLAYLGDNRLYCVNDTAFLRIDLVTHAKVALPAPSLALTSLAEDIEGNRIYGLAVNGELLEYRFDEGHWIDVGNTGLDGTRSGLAYDPIDHVLYAVGSGMGGSLYRVDSEEASATLVGALGTGAVGGGLAYLPSALAFVGYGMDGRVHFLDQDLRDVGGLTMADNLASPTTDGESIYVAPSTGEEIIVYDYAGVEQRRLPVPGIWPDSLTMVDGVLAVGSTAWHDNRVLYLDPHTGVQLASIPRDPIAGDMAYNGAELWTALNNQFPDPEEPNDLTVRNPVTGALLRRIPYPDDACPGFATGLAAAPSGTIILTCDDDWFLLNPASGAVVSRGHLENWLLGLEAIPPVYVAGTLPDGRAHWLDRNLVAMGSFPIGGPGLKGLASDGTRIYALDTGSQSVAVFHLFGVPLQTWTGSLGNAQAIEWANGSLAVSLGSAETRYYDPTAGAVLRTVPGVAPVRAMGWDGWLLWQQGDQLYGTNWQTGVVVRTRQEPRLDCGGVTALTYAGSGQLVAGCGDGKWVRFRTDTGGWMAWGSNGLNMFALATRRQPPHKVYLPLVMR